MNVEDRVVTILKTISNAKDVGGKVMYDVVTRLNSYGYELKDDTDSFLLATAFEKVRSYIKNECNISDIPEGLKSVAADRVIGEFLQGKVVFSPKDLTGFDLDYAVKQIQTGDTNTVFAVGEGCSTPEQKLNAFIAYMLSSGQGQFSVYRKIRW